MQLKLRLICDPAKYTTSNVVHFAFAELDH